MGKPLDSKSVIPLYHQLKEILKENIESGQWKPDDLIPSEHQLMNEFDISRNTVKKAIESLVQEGILYRIQGKGTYVSYPKIEQSLSGFYSFSKVMKERGIDQWDNIIGFSEVEPKSSIKKQLQLSDGETIIELKRLRFANNEPIILETSSLPKKYFPELTKEMIEKSSLYDVMQNDYSIFVKRAKESFEPVLIKDYESHLFNVEEGNPALLLDRVAYDTSGKPVEFCRSIIRGDRCRFYTELL
jgi:GntR family transcriptional regulator